MKQLQEYFTTNKVKDAQGKERFEVIQELIVTKLGGEFCDYLEDGNGIFAGHSFVLVPFELLETIAPIEKHIEQYLGAHIKYTDQPLALT